MATEVKGVPVDVVFAGRRMLVNNKVGYTYYVLNADKTLGEKHTYAAIKGGPIVGCIYTGCNYDKATNTMYGLSLARFAGKYNDPLAVAGWQGLDHEFDKERGAKRAADKYKADLEITLLPLRKIIRALQARGQHAEAAGYRDLIFAELYRPLTKAERDEADE